MCYRKDLKGRKTNIFFFYFFASLLVHGFIRSFMKLKWSFFRSIIQSKKGIHQVLISPHSVLSLLTMSYVDKLSTFWEKYLVNPPFFFPWSIYSKSSFEGDMRTIWPVFGETKYKANSVVLCKGIIIVNVFLVVMLKTSFSLFNYVSHAFGFALPYVFSGLKRSFFFD